MDIKIFPIILTILSSGLIAAIPINSNSNNNNNRKSDNNINNNLQTVMSDEVTAIPDMKKHFVDLNNVSPDVSNLMKIFDTNVDQIRQQQERLRNRKTIENDKNRYVVISSSTTPAQISQDNEENYRLLKIQSELEISLRSNDSDYQILLPKSEQSKFEYAFKAACDIPRHMNVSRWFNGKTWNIMFKPIYRRYNVISSTIRLYKINKDEDTSISNKCDWTQNETYTITISVYIRKHREIKKKTIFTKVIQASFVGWVEVDAFGTLAVWDQAKHNYGIAVDIHNENDEQLDAREHFRLQNCDDQAEPILPWNAYEFLIKQSNRTVSKTDIERLQQMYSYPRLDVISSTTPVENSRPQRHVRHVDHHKQYVNGNSVTLLKNKLHKR